jgi:serine/threonine-protein kinase
MGLGRSRVPLPAEQWAERASEFAGREPHLLSMRAMVRALAGDRAVAESLVSELEERAKSKSVLHADLAFPHAALGNHEHALDALERAYVAREHYMLWLNTHLLWDPLRGNPRFQTLVRKMNFPSSG